MACDGRDTGQAVGLRPAMARSSSGKSVARVAATGGGATYRGQMPVNWYAALVVIVLVGLASVAIAKYHYNQTPTVVEPAVGHDVARRHRLRHLRHVAARPRRLADNLEVGPHHDRFRRAPDRAQDGQ